MATSSYIKLVLKFQKKKILAHYTNIKNIVEFGLLLENKLEFYYKQTILLKLHNTHIPSITSQAHQTVARLYLGQSTRFELFCAYKKWDNHC